MTDGGTSLSRQETLEHPAGSCPELAQLFSAYFHQDWAAQGGGWEAVLDEYATDSPHSVTLAAADELSGILGLRLTDAELDTVLDRLGASVVPAAWGMTASGWLHAILQRLRSAR